MMVVLALPRLRAIPKALAPDWYSSAIAIRIRADHLPPRHEVAAGRGTSR